MEPLAAFGLACNVMQVIDFSLKAVSVCRQIKKHGTTSERKRLSEEMDRICDAADRTKNAFLTPGITDPNEIKLQQEAEKCIDLTNQLQAKLQPLLDTKSLWRVLRKVGKEFKEKDEIASLGSEIERCQRLLQTEILINMKYVPQSPTIFVIC